jgi:tetratricopeptide (TPR) repeat protein
MQGRAIRGACLLRRSSPLILILLIWPFVARPAAAQQVCPGASGPEAEAGWRAYRGNEIPRARRHFEAAIDRCDDAHYARTGLGYVALREGDASGAISLWTVVVSAEPENIDALVGLGMAAWRLGDLGAVHDHFARVLVLDPKHPTAVDYLDRLAAAEIYAAESTGNEGRQEASAPEEPDLPAGSDPTANTEVPLNAADQAWVDGKTDLAFQLYSDRILRDREDEVAAIRLGLMYGWREEYSEALALLTPLVERNPARLDARVARARVWAWSGDLETARGEVLSVLLIDPDDVEANETLLELESWAVVTDEGAPTFAGLLSIAPEESAVALDREPTVGAGGVASRAAYDALLEIDPNNLVARMGLARVLAFSRSFDAALEEYEEVLRRDSDNVDAVIGMARTYGWAGRLVEGERTAQRAVDLSPTNPDAWTALGQIYRWSGRFTDTRDALARAAELDPTNVEIRDQLRSARLVLAPLVTPSVLTEDDSDGNRMVTTAIIGRWRPLDRTTLQARVYFKDLEQDLGDVGVIDNAARGFIISGVHVLERGYSISSSLGGDKTDGPGDPAFLAFRLGAATPDGRALRLGVNFATQGLTETAALAQREVRSTEVVVSGRWLPISGWRVDGNISLGQYDGTEANARRSGFLGVTKRVGTAISLGASVRGFSFQKNLFDGYFDPDFYGIGELTGAWTHRVSHWTLRLEVAPGVQKVTRAGEASGAMRANARIAYRLGMEREVSLSFARSTAGLTRLSSGNTAYRYTGIVLGLGWSF